MIIVYAIAGVLLGLVAFVVRRRASAAQESYHAQEQAYQTHVRNMPKVTSHNDPSHVVAIARVGKAIDAREAAEAKHDQWQGRLTAVNGLRQGLHGWRGRKAPYVLGFLDAVGLVGVVDLFGLHGQIGESIVAFAKTLFTTASGG